MYEENGVREYWIVFQNDETVQVFDLVNGKYQYRKTYSNDSIIPVGIFKDFKIKLNEIKEKENKLKFTTDHSNLF